MAFGTGRGARNGCARAAAASSTTTTTTAATTATRTRFGEYTDGVALDGKRRRVLLSSGRARRASAAVRVRVRAHAGEDRALEDDRAWTEAAARGAGLGL